MKIFILNNGGFNPLDKDNFLSYKDFGIDEILSTFIGKRLEFFGYKDYQFIRNLEEVGQYDCRIDQANATFYVVVLDEADRPISPEAAVDFDLLVSCRYIQDWRRTY